MARYFIDRPIFAWVIAIVIMLAGALAVVELPVSQYPEIAPPSVRVTTEYTAASAETSYPTVLAELTGWNVVNAGVPGDTSAQALARLPALLAEHRPKLVIVSIGGNDFLRKLPESDTRANVHAACKLALESGAQVLLVAVPRATVAAALGQMTDHALYAEVAKDLNIPLQREGWGEVLAQAELRSDQVHANAKGYAQFARSVQGTAAAAGLLPR